MKELDKYDPIKEVFNAISLSFNPNVLTNVPTHHQSLQIKPTKYGNSNSLLLIKFCFY